MNQKLARAIIITCLIVIAVCSGVILVFFPEEFPGVMGKGLYIVFVGFVFAFFLMTIKRLK